MTLRSSLAIHSTIHGVDTVAEITCGGCLFFRENRCYQAPPIIVVSGEKVKYARPYVYSTDFCSEWRNKFQWDTEEDGE